MKHDDGVIGLKISEEVIYYKEHTIHTGSCPSWEDLSSCVPLLTKGWYELSLLSVPDRIAVIKDIWLSHIGNYIEDELSFGVLDCFFEMMEDVYFYAFTGDQSLFADVRMVYVLKDGKGFFHGSPPFFGEIAQFLSQRFNRRFSEGYRAFFGIHDGFAFDDDMGVIPTKYLVRTYHRLRNQLRAEESFREFITNGGYGFVPFYESRSLNEYQCFLVDSEVIGSRDDLNVACSLDDSKPVIDCLTGDRTIEAGAECYWTFPDWLMNYLREGWGDGHGES